jgi:hypothetical protein
MDGNALCFNRKQLTYKKLIAISGEKDPFFYDKNSRIILILTKIFCIYLRAHIKTVLYESNGKNCTHTPTVAVCDRHRNILLKIMKFRIDLLILFN